MPNIDSNPLTLSEAARFGIDYAREQLAGKSILVLTGAGVSTESGIPDYRGEGKTERHPMTFDVFMGSDQARARYWARSYVGWSVIAKAKPNGSHFARKSRAHLPHHYPECRFPSSASWLEKSN